MDKNLKKIVNQFKDDDNYINKIIVSLFIESNGLKVENNILIKSLIIKDDNVLNKFRSTIKGTITFDDIIEAFELTIPAKEKIINGAVYTPSYIKEFIVDETLRNTSKVPEELLTADISCGCGAFLFTLSKKIKEITGATYKEIFKKNIYGLDISESSIKRAEILLSLLAISQQEDELKFELNLYIENALSFNWFENEKIKNNGGFDVIVGNPPYVRAKNIDDTSKRLLSNLEITRSGNPDLYIAFFEVGLKYINNNGVLGYITVNSFFKSVNARELRRYFKNMKYTFSIIDFGNEKIFTGKSAYTCICIISKKESLTINYKKEKSTSLSSNSLVTTNKISYESLDNYRGWLLNDNSIIRNINLIENTGTPLGKKYKIRNGIATLSNDIYIFKPVKENDIYYILERNKKHYEIEKLICKDIIKPNILKYESEIDNNLEKLIYPYKKNTNSIIEQDEFKALFPKAYIYLTDNKDALSMRDKGEGNYPAWYAFGRTQALTDTGFKLLFPYMAKNPHFVFSDNEEMLIYCGYAIFHESAEELKVLKKILESKVFDYYIRNTSKPYSGNFYSYAKNYVKNFGICELDEEEKMFLCNGSSKDLIDKFLINKYQLEL